MTSLKEKISEYLPILQKRRSKETDKDKKYALKIKIDELKKLRDDL